MIVRQWKAVLNTGNVPADLQEAHRMLIMARMGLGTMTAHDMSDLPLPLTLQLSMLAAAYNNPPKRKPTKWQS